PSGVNRKVIVNWHRSSIGSNFCTYALNSSNASSGRTNRGTGVVPSIISSSPSPSRSLSEQLFTITSAGKHREILGTSMISKSQEETEVSFCLGERALEAEMGRLS